MGRMTTIREALACLDTAEFEAMSKDLKLAYLIGTLCRAAKEEKAREYVTRRIHCPTHNRRLVCPACQD